MVEKLDGTFRAGESEWNLCHSLCALNSELHWQCPMRMLSTPSNRFIGRRFSSGYLQANAIIIFHCSILIKTKISWLVNGLCYFMLVPSADRTTPPPPHSEYKYIFRSAQRCAEPSRGEQRRFH